VTPDETVRVVVADDQSAVREGLVLLLGTLPGITVVGEAADGDAAAVDLVAATSPDVVLMDLNMPRCDGSPTGRSPSRFFVSEATVKTHVNRIYAKTGSRDRVQAMLFAYAYAYANGYADPASS
jgi:DNA-binding NarL/FixJ family response regulator